MTQKELVKRHLEDFGEITTFEAFKEYGITRLSQYIMLLRRDGHIITNKTVSATNRYGSKVHYDRFIYGGKNEQIQK